MPKVGWKACCGGHYVLRMAIESVIETVSAQRTACVLVVIVTACVLMVIVTACVLMVIVTLNVVEVMVIVTEVEVPLVSVPFHISGCFPQQNWEMDCVSDFACPLEEGHREG